MSLQRRTLIFALLCAGSLAVCWKSYATIWKLSWESDLYSHIAFIPIACALLIWMRRSQIFAEPRASAKTGALLGAIGTATCWLSQSHLLLRDGDALAVLGVVLVWIAIFIGVYGQFAARSARFALLFLFLAVPLPTIVSDKVIAWLQNGSAALSVWVFQVLRVPVYRDGVLLTIPGLTVEVARQCSGIRSSIALLLTFLVAGHLSLHSNWRKSLLLLAVVPVVLIKNSLRIVTVTMLAAYVNPAFLTGKLHERGGVVFYLLGIALLGGVLKLLRRAEQKGRPPYVAAPAADPAALSVATIAGRG
jgi:exosortase